ncbi:hypothetical protein N9406_07220 [Verrucomicrobiales bacterium]|nr:hypothetical protein [Verrucomicrobiales bacterium]MDB3940742.1 hypothetical protein [Verrucomicrobiales bacterium]
MEETEDQGRTPESEEMYDSEMTPYIGKSKGGSGEEARQTLLDNIGWMKKMAAEGK